jgi:two-component system cell cycle sensor histidine kinase/response regulator CckA
VISKEWQLLGRSVKSVFRAIFDSALDPLLLLDDHRRLVDANAAAGAMFRAEPRDLAGHTIDEFLSRTSADEFASQWPEILRRGESHGELTIPDVDGEHIVEFSFKARVVPHRHLFIWRDVSERKRLEARLRQSQKMETVGRLAGGVAHDFNNLLTVILGNAGLALDHAESHAKEQLVEIVVAAERAASLTRQLLAFSRKQILQPTVINLNDVLSSIENMLRRLLAETIELQTTKDPGLWAVKVDPTQFEQVIVNLVVNAREAMANGGHVRLETANVEIGPRTMTHVTADVPPGCYVRVSVTDNGTGMDEATRSQIFEPFFTTKGSEKGAGLGLATVYGIVRQSCGYLTVESALGKGSTFSVYLPRVEQPAQHAAPANELASPLTGSETILLVEDEDAVRTLAKQVLTRYGYHVLVAEGGETALQIAAQHRIDLLVTDVVMPRMDGHELATTLRARRDHLKVVFMSGYTGEAAALESSMKDAVFLPKPFTAVGLAGAVRKLLDVGNVVPSVSSR